MEDIIISDLKESIEVKKEVMRILPAKITEGARWVIEAIKNKKKVLIFGNGGSAADAQHIASELVGRFKMDRRGLPAIALTTDTSILTSVSNDYGFETAFSKQVEALAAEGDVVIGISTSGHSKNVIKAIEVAKEKRAKTIGLTGGDGGKLAEIVDLAIIVPSNNTPRIQESHITIGHIICNLVEREIFGIK